MSLRALAKAALIDFGHLSRIESGTRPPPGGPAIRKLDEVLGTGGVLAAMLHEPWILDGGLWRPDESERLAADLAAAAPTAENATALAHRWLLAEPPQVIESRAGRRIGMGMVRKVQKRVRDLRVMDDYVGGADTYAMVTAELAATIGLLRTRAYTDEVGRRLLVALGELAQLAGWTSSDAGRYVEADRRQPADDDPDWVYWLSPEEVEVMAGRVWTETQRPLRAVPILERAIAGYGDDTGRETALYQSWMAESLEQANEPDRAAAAATKALRLSKQAGSVRAGDRVSLLRRKLRRHAGNPAVDAFLEESA
jgi:hypothetical protein